MAKKDSDAPVKVRVLVAGEYGGKVAAVDDVIELSAADARDFAGQYSVDAHPDAVAYAEGLKAKA